MKKLTGFGRMKDFSQRKNKQNSCSSLFLNHILRHSTNFIAYSKLCKYSRYQIGPTEKVKKMKNFEKIGKIEKNTVHQVFNWSLFNFSKKK